MSIATEITRLQTAKADLKTAIEGKGVTVPSATLLDGYADLVDSIETGGGGEDVVALIAARTITSIESGFTTLTAARLLENCYSLTSVRFPNWESGAGGFICNGCSALTSVFVPKLKTMAANNFANCTSLRVVVLPSFTNYGNNGNFDGCTALEVVDYAAETINTRSFFSQKEHQNNTALETIIIRATNAVANLGNLNNLTGTPFADGGTGGTLYVPSALISSYQAATNWSTILGYTNNNIAAIEGSQYEDYYADGTPISA